MAELGSRDLSRAGDIGVGIGGDALMAISTSTPAPPWLLLGTDLTFRNAEGLNPSPFPKMAIVLVRICNRQFQGTILLKWTLTSRDRPTL